MRVLVFLLPVLAISQAALAQSYCLLDESGGRSCGIPTLQQCEQSLVGVGGSCQIDDSAQLGPPIKGPFQRMFERAEENQNDQRPRSPDLDDVPPPPGN
jgi:hypothetical protein